MIFTFLTFLILSINHLYYFIYDCLGKKASSSKKGVKKSSTKQSTTSPTTPAKKSTKKEEVVVDDEEDDQKEEAPLAPANDSNVSHSLVYTHSICIIASHIIERM